METLQTQFSGYGSTAAVVARTLDKIGLKSALETWDDDTIERVVNAFTDEKFPTVIALNKIDHPDADKNIAKIAKKQDPESIVLCSAVSEVFLRKLAKQGYVRYEEGSEFVDTREDLIAAGDPDGGGLKELDEKLKEKIENLKDMVLYRFGSTGVVEVLSRASKLLGLVPVFPVRNIHSFGSGAAGQQAVFRDCVLVGKYALPLLLCCTITDERQEHNRARCGTKNHGRCPNCVHRGPWSDPSGRRRDSRSWKKRRKPFPSLFPLPTTTNTPADPLLQSRARIVAKSIETCILELPINPPQPTLNSQLPYSIT